MYQLCVINVAQDAFKLLTGLTFELATFFAVIINQSASDFSAITANAGNYFTPLKITFNFTDTNRKQADAGLLDGFAGASIEIESA